MKISKHEAGGYSPKRGSVTHPFREYKRADKGDRGDKSDKGDKGDKGDKSKVHTSTKLQSNSSIDELKESAKGSGNESSNNQQVIVEEFHNVFIY